MFIIKHRKIFLSISALLVATALISIFSFGFNPGTDFKGGTVYEVEFTNSRPDLATIRPNLEKLGFGQISVQFVGDKGLLLKTKTIDQDQKQLITDQLNKSGTFIEKRFSSIGPAVGRELMKKGVVAIALVILIVILFISFAFYNVSYIISSWKYGVATIIALLHDIILPSGIVAYLGYSQGFEADALFLTALLTIMALSVNDTIVIFDRIRENVKNHLGHNFEETVGISLDQSIVRSINTSLTIILTLIALYLFGADSTRNFALIMALGIFFGTYSSIFVASPLLVTWEKWTTRRGPTRN
ncbi:MAG: protein translocase subunit SecF [Candidatus Vogelbacteria bacterium CG22_combo_CG10-13_8_21_14_all_37_9]|uniref:Protein-export membrane protein SecF n=1 Tax=Candidatus Vogelbacteria bacterium CG22_combo_CG10-13_8_21_14_all_37_9 TaxID=1975046 RepID=A0A2H0BLI4_9BACT|nr:MAG: protein-export membrane protein SecF [bacterium CG10_37_50]PIP58464.1 MAG: protein translocase subunit SecF [Candidatus Vogelbacteria bacterium CG22_combo_CG10-13_8_21_14_all_37_9]